MTFKKEITTKEAPPLYSQKEADAYAAGHNSLVEEINNLNACIVKAEQDLAEERTTNNALKNEMEEIKVNADIWRRTVNTQQGRIDHLFPLVRSYGDQLQKANTKIKELEDLATARLIDNNNLRQLVDELTTEFACLQTKLSNTETNLTITRNALGDALLMNENLKEDLQKITAEREQLEDDVHHWRNSYYRFLNER